MITPSEPKERPESRGPARAFRVHDRLPARDGGGHGQGLRLTVRASIVDGWRKNTILAYRGVQPRAQGTPEYYIDVYDHASVIIY
jgi:hypothetical protein